jgi:tRNA pseudouridine38-40 synthase
VKVALGVEYDGTNFCGWQSQPDQRTVQDCLAEALHKITGEGSKIVAAGRTDSGVHALQQVAHFETKANRSERNWVLGLNSNLPADMNVTWARPVPDDFSARFSALNRSYRYIIHNRVSRSSVHANRMWWIFSSLDVERMQAAADLLIGHHDYSAFRAKLCQAHSPIKTVDKITVTRHGDCIAIDVKAQSFLHHMVRNLVGVLVPIGEGRKPVEWATEVLASRDRAQGGITSPPEGLYFIDVEYPQQYKLPKVSAFPVVW